MQKKQVDAGLMPGSGRSPGGGHGNPLQYSYLGNPINRGSWKATVHKVTKSHMRLNTQYLRYSITMLLKHPFAKGMGFCQWFLFGFFFSPWGIWHTRKCWDIKCSVWWIYTELHPYAIASQIQDTKIYCNLEGFLCSFSIYNCLRNSISLSSVTIVASCLWLYFI